MQAVSRKWKSAFLTILLLLTACASTGSISDGSQVDPLNGIVVFKVTTNIEHGQLQYKKFSLQETPESLRREYFFGPDQSVVIERGEKYWLMSVEPGDYMWSKVIANPDRRTASFHSSNRFTVESKEITYVGHIELSEDSGMVRISISDDESDMISYIRSNYPIYFSTMKFSKSVTAVRR